MTLQRSADDVDCRNVGLNEGVTAARCMEVAPDSTPIEDARHLLCYNDTHELVQWIKLMNQFNQPRGFEEVQTAVLDLLRCRLEYSQKSNYRKGLPISKRGKAALERGSISRDWYRSFLVDYPELKNDFPSTLDPQRGQWSTAGVRTKHGRLLTDWLKRIHIMGDDGNLIPEEVRRLGNCDESPNPTASGKSVNKKKVLGGRGHKVTKGGQERSENISIMPLLSMSEQFEVLATQIILKSGSNEPSKKGKLELDKRHVGMMKDRFIQFNHTGSSYQDGDTFVTFLVMVAKVLDHYEIEHTAVKPYGLLTDGHKSRYCIAALRKAKELHISLYFFPPHATTLYQPLDKLFDSWHKKYSEKLEAWRTDTQKAKASVHPPVPPRSACVGFAIELVVDGWLSDNQIEFGFEQCGITMHWFDETMIPNHLLMPEPSTVSPGKARFIMGPTLPITPGKKLGQSDPEYLKYRGDYWKGFATGVINEPIKMRDCGALRIPTDGAKNDFVPGEGKKTVTFYGDIDSAAVLELAEKQHAEEADAVVKSAAERVETDPALWLFLLKGYHLNFDSKLMKLTVVTFFKENSVLLKMLKSRQVDKTLNINSLKHGVPIIVEWILRELSISTAKEMQPPLSSEGRSTIVGQLELSKYWESKLKVVLDQCLVAPPPPPPGLPSAQDEINSVLIQSAVLEQKGAIMAQVEAADRKRKGIGDTTDHRPKRLCGAEDQTATEG
jgi:hypothetical protein